MGVAVEDVAGWIDDVASERVFPGGGSTRFWRGSVGIEEWP